MGRHRVVKVSQEFYDFIRAWQIYRMNDGQKFAFKAGFADLTKDFLTHYWNAMSLSRIGKKVENCYKEVTERNKKKVV